ncbi:TVP38/TMEM64 family protein [Catenovulum sediminis]|uniref:TVP38/TMEM64 family membrane protein n=1 Tax=Catenovulum sediminis TaxID=1740262 RepID=A0ABV1RJ77_9ALTE
MKALFKIIFIMAACFAATFLLVKFTGVLTITQIESWLIQAKTLSPIYVSTIVILLLFADLFIAVPTLTITILSGYFLGYTYGVMAAITGVTLAGIVGYLLSKRYGSSILQYIVADEEKRNEAVYLFHQHGFAMILLSRAMPILPEVSTCLAGMTQMKFRKFITAWLLSALPYISIAVYAGSVSTLENPKPAIFTAIALSLILWFSWFIYHQVKKKPVT